MDKQYWVIGGEYADCEFKGFVEGKARIAGPYGNEQRALDEWHRLTFHDRACATERYHITVEPRA
jgi:hypothetical protein